MNKKLITIAFAAVLATMATSCQKENLLEDINHVESENAQYTISYTVDGVSSTLSFVGEDACHDFLNHLFALAEEGHKVSFRNNNETLRTHYAKKTVTYTTTNKEEAYAWGERMFNQGYEVSVTFDKETATYICIAQK